MFKSIFGRLFWTYSILLLLMLSTISLSMAILFKNFTERKQIENITSVVDTVEYWISHEGESGNSSDEENNYFNSIPPVNKSIKSMINALGHFTMSDVTIVAHDGEVIYSTNGINKVPTSALKCIETDERVITSSNFEKFYGHDVLTVSFPLHRNGQSVAAIIFNKGFPDIYRTVMELLVMFLLSMLLSIAVAFIIVYIQAKKISAPIVKINKAAQKIAAGNFSERVNVTSMDEIGQLASTFNFMASSIERADQNRQRFVSDISHELRTPMTSISGFISGMLDGTITDENRDYYLQIVLDESTRLTKLVNDMLEMSKMQSDEFKLDIAPFNITELICTCLIEFENKIESKSLDVKVDFRPEKLVALGDKYQIKRVLINLLDNAVKFSHSSTTISMNTWIEQGKAHISVSNIGDGIKENDIKHIFDRFYKTDKSREKDRTGAGLGLSLVQNIIRLHNQTITVKSLPYGDDNLKITTFEFTLEVK